MPKPFSVPLHCPFCGRPMSVRIQLPRHFEPGAEPVPKIIKCPYDGCDGQLAPVIHGDVVAVWTGHENLA